MGETNKLNLLAKVVVAATLVAYLSVFALFLALFAGLIDVETHIQYAVHGTRAIAITTLLTAVMAVHHLVSQRRGRRQARTAVEVVLPSSSEGGLETASLPLRSEPEA